MRCTRWRIVDAKAGEAFVGAEGEKRIADLTRQGL